jgi:hypothetical protein
LRQFGFGLVDATAAVRLAETWGPATPWRILRTELRARRLAIPDNASAGVSDSISVTHIDVERVDVTLQVTHPFIETSRWRFSHRAACALLPASPGEAP